MANNPKSNLHDAVRRSDETAVKRFIAQGESVNAIDEKKRTPLHLACWTGNAEIVKILLRQKSNVNAKAIDCFTPIHFAAQNNHVDCIRAVADKNKGTLNAKTKGNKTPLQLAIAKKHIDSIAALIEVGADFSYLLDTNGELLGEFSEDVKTCILDSIANRRLKKNGESSTSDSQSAVIEPSSTDRKRKFDDIKPKVSITYEE